MTLGDALAPLQGLEGCYRPMTCAPRWKPASRPGTDRFFEDGSDLID